MGEARQKHGYTLPAPHPKYKERVFYLNMFRVNKLRSYQIDSGGLEGPGLDLYDAGLRALGHGLQDVGAQHHHLHLIGIPCGQEVLFNFAYYSYVYEFTRPIEQTFLCIKYK